MRETLKKKDKTCLYLKKRTFKTFQSLKKQRSKNAFWNMLLRETTYFAFFVLFRKAKLEVRKCTMIRFWEKPIQLVRYWMKRLETCQNLKKSAWEKRRYESCYSEKMAFFAFSPFFKKQDFKSFQSIRVLTKSLACHILN